MPYICRKIGVPLHAYACWDFDEYRKPAPGMWQAVKQLVAAAAANQVGARQRCLCPEYFPFSRSRRLLAHRLHCIVLRRRCSRSTCRPRGYRPQCVGLRPFSLCWTGSTLTSLRLDRLVSEFALNAGLRFMTPEEVFDNAPPDPDWALWGWNPFRYAHDSTPPLRGSHQVDAAKSLRRGVPAVDQSEVVLLVGAPASGKTRHWQHVLQPQGYELLASRLSLLAFADRASPWLTMLDNVSTGVRNRERLFRTAARAGQAAGTARRSRSGEQCASLAGRSVPRPARPHCLLVFVPVAVLAPESARRRPHKLPARPGPCGCLLPRRWVRRSGVRPRGRRALEAQQRLEDGVSARRRTAEFPRAARTTCPDEARTDRSVQEVGTRLGGTDAR